MWARRIQVRIFPIEPNSRKHRQIAVHAVDQIRWRIERIRLPRLNTEKFSARAAPKRVGEGGPEGIHAESRTSTARATRWKSAATARARAVVGYEDHNVRPDTDFKLIWSQDKDPSVSAFSVGRPGRPTAIFLLMASPGFDVDPKKVQPPRYLLRSRHERFHGRPKTGTGKEGIAILPG